MKITLSAVAAASLGVVAASLALGARPQHDSVADAGQVFVRRCSSCHQAPDLRFATDRAWLDQVNRTA